MKRAALILSLIIIIPPHITSCFRRGSWSRGIFFNSSGTPPIDKCTVENNTFVGRFNGAIYNFGGLDMIFRNNTQYANNLPGETQTKNGLIFNNGGKFFNGQSWQTAAGHSILGTNVRKAP